MKPAMTRLTARLRGVAALLLAVAVMTGCEKDMFAFKPEFSVNIFYPGKKWPNMEKMMPNEQQVFNELGKPDAFRAQILFQYWRDGLRGATGTARLTAALKAELPRRMHALIDELGDASKR